jgi:uncharacterized cupredoxin-like copper-binding protein
MPPGVTRTRLIVLALALLAAVIWWSSQRGSAQRGINVKVRDFAIKAPKRMAAGEVVLQVTNRGPDTHELMLVRVDGKEMPLRPDNLTVDETRLEPRTVDTLEDVYPDTVRSWKLQLTPGRYVLLCNMSGHYLGGMHRGLIVR